MNWKELLREKGYKITSGCSSCGGWSRFTNGINLIRIKSKFAKLSINGTGKVSNDKSARLRLVKLDELEQYL